ncbi:MAG: ribonuclease III [Thermodesulfobacteriota bacterium]
MDIKRLEKNLGYRFKQKQLLQTALCHSSFINEQQPAGNLKNNETLEFLGDAVLNLIAGHILMAQHPAVKEGELSRMRAGLVNEKQLAAIARKLDIGAHLLLGKGEIQTGGYDKNSILADALEAVIAAVYLDGGFMVAFRLIEQHFATLFQSMSPAAVDLDYKSRLQELVQTSLKVTPHYKVVSESGPDHDKTFTVQLKVRDVTTMGIGKNKKAAEQNAAREYLERMEAKNG